MSTKPTHFLQPNPLDDPEPLSTRHSRVIFCVGGDRFAIDFTSTVTELKPEPADVIPIQKKRLAKRKPMGSERHDRTSSLRLRAVNQRREILSLGHPHVKTLKSELRKKPTPESI